MQTPFVVDCIKEPEKNKSRPSIRRLISRRLASEISIPRIERLLAQGTVASPCSVAGLGIIRVAPDAGADYSSNPVSSVLPSHLCERNAERFRGTVASLFIVVVLLTVFVVAPVTVSVVV